MKILGIDYGTKRIGLALSNESQTVAFPQEVIPADGGAVGKVIKICLAEKVSKIVIGESKNYVGGFNLVHAQALKFVDQLKKQFSVEIIWQPEFFSTIEATRLIDKDKETDARAAAIILQSYLDRYV